ncbi:amidohydrolase, imidazolonepropionase [Belliella baltica DSM 15883]|uniref:Amidohydrolase, imidazolonepropionase n=1 Tax=Belliella baltica (strain DSM 15883 / CIP 108006 / LMG 21964 / BA134) TaxID=866536 RepID=I3Z6X9_BELBD|nr:amidohydrolase family protein [Belliella baltica]AFL84997.1 amidohydrolase, imidazolonepropionase [Belliella baltica DSM 15883]
MKRIFALLFVLALINQVTFAQKTFIHAGKMVDVKSNKTLSEMTIIIEDNIILDVQKGYTVAGASDKVIDLKSKTVMPGLMDMHVHLENETSPRRYLDRFVENEADVAFNSTIFAKTTLMAGFTTVRDLGGTGVNISLRNAINAGKVDGPRVITSGKSIAPTGGHADPTNGMKRELMGDPGPDQGVINGVADARKAVRQQVKNGSDVIKITATGGVLSVARDGNAPQFQQDEINAVIETATDFGIHVAAHAHGDEGMKRAVIGGIHSIEHGTYMSEETMDMMIKAGTWYVPTITAGKSVAEYARIPGYYPAAVKTKAETIGPLIQSTFGKAYKRGVKIAFGTDAGVFPHGENYREFVYMTEMGMPNLEAIQSATLRAAELLGMEDKIGIIEKGMLADIIAVDGDPEKDIKVMKEVVFVMKDGKVYKME